MIRFTVAPIERSGIYRGPKYFKWRMNPAGIDCPYGWKFYGLIDFCIVAADLTADQLALLETYPDLLIIPQNIDNNLKPAAVTIARDYLENANIPVAWVTVADTYRGVLRSVCGIFEFMGRVTFLLQAPFPFASVGLNTQFGAFPQNVKDAMIQAADELSLDRSGLRDTTRLRGILKSMADQFASRIYDFRVTTL